VDAHDHEAPEPQAGLLKEDFCHQPQDLLCVPMGDAFNLVRQAGSNALVLFQHKIVSRLQLKHLLQMSLLDGEDVVPFSRRTVGSCRAPPPAFQLMKKKGSTACL
jgi:hypothetical protein